MTDVSAARSSRPHHNKGIRSGMRSGAQLPSGDTPRGSKSFGLLGRSSFEPSGSSVEPVVGVGGVGGRKRCARRLGGWHSGDPAGRRRRRMPGRIRVMREGKAHA